MSDSSVDPDTELRVSRREAARRFEQQIAAGEELRHKEHYTENCTNQILEGIAEWHEANQRMLRDVFKTSTVSDRYREETATDSNLAHHSWNGKIREVSEILYKRIQHLQLVYLLYRIAEKTGGPFENGSAAEPSVGVELLPVGPSSSSVESALERVDPALAASYRQVRADLADVSRTSWAGTAHELREILGTLLRKLAPDEAVVNQTWFNQEPNTTGPTQKQRVRYILQQRNAGSKEREVAQHVAALETMVGEVVRAMYSRASDAAHRFKGRTEATRLLNYFDAFAHDLLDIGSAG